MSEFSTNQRDRHDHRCKQCVAAAGSKTRALAAKAYCSVRSTRFALSQRTLAARTELLLGMPPGGCNVACHPVQIGVPTVLNIASYRCQ